MDPTTHARATNGIGRLWHRSRLNRRSLGAAGVAVAVIAVFMQSGPLAGAASTGTFKNYNVHVAPGAVLASNSQTSVTVNLQNEITSNTSFGSVALTITNLDGAAIDTPSLPNGWSVSNTPPPGVTVLLVSKKSVSIAPGATLPLVLDITPSTAGTITIGTEVKQSNDFSGTGNGFNYDSANSNPTVEVVNSVALTFDQPPTDVQQSNTSTPTFFGMCPPVSVKATAPDGALVGGVTVTLSNGTGNPGLIYNPASLASGAISQGNGVATFGADCNHGVGATNLGSGYTLIASAATPSGTVTSSPSQPSFAVVQLLFTCTTNPCNTPTIQGQSGTKGNASISFGTPGYKVLGNFGGSSLVCDSLVTTIPGDELNLQTSVGASGVVTMTFPKSVVNNLANNGTPLMQVCAGASAFFPGSADQGSGVTPEWQGLVANCGANYTTIVDNICVLSRSKQAANEIIQIFVQNLSDPGFW